MTNQEKEPAVEPFKRKLRLAKLAKQTFNLVVPGAIAEAVAMATQRREQLDRNEINKLKAQMERLREIVSQQAIAIESLQKQLKNCTCKKAGERIIQFTFHNLNIINCYLLRYYYFQQKTKN